MRVKVTDVLVYTTINRYCYFNSIFDLVISPRTLGCLTCKRFNPFFGVELALPFLLCGVEPGNEATGHNR